MLTLRDWSHKMEVSTNISVNSSAAVLDAILLLLTQL